MTVQEAGAIWEGTCRKYSSHRASCLITKTAWKHVNFHFQDECSSFCSVSHPHSEHCLCALVSDYAAVLVMGMPDWFLIQPELGRLGNSNFYPQPWRLKPLCTIKEVILNCDDKLLTCTKSQIHCLPTWTTLLLDYLPTEQQLPSTSSFGLHHIPSGNNKIWWGSSVNLAWPKSRDTRQLATSIQSIREKSWETLS